MSNTTNIPECCEPFNYEEALKRPKDIVTRDGRTVKIAGYNPDADNTEKLLGWILFKNNSDSGECWSAAGEYNKSSSSDKDLFLRAKTVVKYQNNYGPNDNGVFLYDSIDEAKISARTDLIAIVAYTYQANSLIKVEIVHRH